MMISPSIGDGWEAFKAAEFGGPKFARWMKKLDEACWKKAGCSIYDLADMPYLDWFEDGVSPAAAAKMALREEGFEG